MNITKNVVDDVNLLLNIEIEKADYAEEVEKALKEYRHNYSMRGFRKGMTPISLLRKMFGPRVTSDAVNRVLQNALAQYITENNLHVLGEPLIDEAWTPVDFATVESFSVPFKVAIAPEFNVTLNQDVKVPYYEITVEDKLVDNQIEGYRRQFGEQVDAEEVEADDIVKGDVAELDLEGNIVEGGILAEGATIYPRYFSNDDEKAKFVGAKKFASVDFNPAAATNNNVNEMASMLQIEKEKAGGLTANFRFTINEIKRHQSAELNEDLFKKVFGEECTTEEAFKAKIREAIAGQLAENSEARFTVDAAETLKAQVGDLKFPEEHLKQWLIQTGKAKDAEKLNEDMPKMLEDLKWQLIAEKIYEDNKLAINDDDVKAMIAKVFRSRMMQYGMMSIPQEYIDSFVTNIMNDQKEVGQYREYAKDQKVFDKIRESVSLDKKEVTLEEFSKIGQE
jgi:trigger factor